MLSAASCFGSAFFYNNQPAFVCHFSLSVASEGILCLKCDLVMVPTSANLREGLNLSTLAKSPLVRKSMLVRPH